MNNFKKGLTLTNLSKIIAWTYPHGSYACFTEIIRFRGKTEIKVRAVSHLFDFICLLIASWSVFKLNATFLIELIGMD